MRPQKLPSHLINHKKAGYFNRLFIYPTSFKMQEGGKGKQTGSIDKLCDPAG
ncbi:hypothetical protein GCM10009131_27310 [Morganella psychrotolerans]